MKQSFIKGIKKNALVVVAFVALAIFMSNKNPGYKNDVAAKCSTGYNISISKLKQFMVDSLHGNQFEGGVYSKQSLLAAINEIPGDSVYIMNILKNCNIAQGTELAFTSPQASGVAFSSRPSCYPCPGKACCPQKVCAARLDRSCINYMVYNGFTNSRDPNILSANE